MTFLSQGDYMFPFEAGLYWAKHFFIWSFQTGAANPDGIIRFPSRLLNFIVFELFGSVGVSYFYIFSSLAIIFVAFYIFAIHFLGVKQRSTRLLAAAFFALNPIFLGYLAKVGLLIGVAMLPLCLVVLKLGFTRSQFRYFILYVLLLNVSLIHPFTFTVNLAVSGFYAVYLWRSQKDFLRKHWLKVLGLLTVSLMLYAYFILPLMSLGSIGRPEALSEEINNAPVDHTALVDFANARNPLIALSLSKDVFLDFGYYNAGYQPIYMAAAFVFYLIVFGLYVWNEKHLNKTNRSLMTILLTCFIGLQLLSMAVFFDINRLIKLLIGLPGGWAFRSPLKWQLYIPLVLGTMICILLENISVQKIRRSASAALIITTVLMGLFLSFDISRLLLKPRQFEHLQGLNSANLDGKNMLFINNDTCFTFFQEHLRLAGEFNQVMISHNVQLKRIKTAHADTVNLGAYDYIFGCQSSVAHPMQGDQRFKRIETFVGGTLELYQNRTPQSYIYATDSVFAIDKTRNLRDKYRFVHDRLKRPFDFVTSFSDQPVYGLQDPFEDLTVSNIQDDKILTKLWLLRPDHDQLIAQPQEDALFYKAEPGRTSFSPRPDEGMTPILKSAISLEVVSGREQEFAYLQPKQGQRNLIPNASLEQGLWQTDVWDCYDYDDQPAITMRLNEKDAADGRKSLELESQSHIACTGPHDIPVKRSARYLLSFRYKGESGGYRLTFDDPSRSTISDRLPAKGDDWQEFITEVEVPAQASRLSLKVEAIPTNQKSQATLYDDFSLIQIPDLQGRFYVASSPESALKKPKTVRFKQIDPTKKRVHIEKAQAGFYLAMRDSYHPRWQVRLAGGDGLFAKINSRSVIREADHLRLNGFMNGWYIEPAALCRDNPAGCTRNADGSYDLELVIEFTPQRWFYIGLIFSGLAASGVAGYFILLGLRRYKDGGGRYWRA